MFDNPKKELRELEDQLLAAEQNHAPAQKIADDPFAEYAPLDLDVDDVPIRNFANGYGQKIPVYPPEPAEIPIEEEVPAPVEKRSPGLVFLTVVEVLAILGVAAYWLLHLL